MRPVAFLSAPYTSKDADEVEKRMKYYSLAAAKIEREGKYHVLQGLGSHWITQYDPELPGDFEYWESASLSLLSKCDVMILLALPGWEESIGVQGELEYAEENHIPVFMMEPTIPW